MAKIMNYKVYRDEWVKLYNEGMSIRQISRQYNINKNSVSLQIRKEITLRAKSLHKDKAEEFYKLYLKGYTINAIAVKYNIASSTVKAILLDKYNIKSDDDKKKFLHLKEDLIKDYDCGMSLSQLSQKYNLSRQTASNYIKEEIKLRSYSQSRLTCKVNEDYFDNMDDEKSYTLGKIFAFGNLYEHNTSRYLNLCINNDRKNELVFLLNILCDKNADDCLVQTEGNSGYYARIHSEKLYDQLSKFGLGVSLPLNNKNINVDKFFEGYLCIRTNINNGIIRISGSSAYKEQIFKYLQSKDMNITKSNKFINRGEIHIYKNQDKLRYIELFNFTLDLIDEYIETSKVEDNSWIKFLNKYDLN